MWCGHASGTPTDRSSDRIPPVALRQWQVAARISLAWQPRWKLALMAPWLYFYMVRMVRRLDPERLPAEARADARDFVRQVIGSSHSRGRR